MPKAKPKPKATGSGATTDGQPTVAGWRSRIVGHDRIAASQLLANPANHRRHNQRQHDVVTASLDELGIVKSVIVNRTTGLLVDGHERVELALGRSPEALVDVEYVELSPDEERKAILVLDASSELATTDRDAMLNLMDSLHVESLPLMDFFADMKGSEALAKDVVEDDPPDPPKKPVVRLGDIWLLGRHRVLCGDSTDRDAVARFMGGVKADMLLTDPPYGVSYVGKTKQAMEIENDDLDEDGLRVLNRQVFDVAASVCRPGAYWYATVPAGPLHLLFAQDWKDRNVLRQIMVWRKDSMVLGHSEYHYQHEPILFGWLPGKRHKNRDRTRTTVWDVPRPKRNDVHPTMKPVELWARAIADGSRAGEVVIDLFLGSGTAVMACHQLERTCYGVELDPAYAQVVLERFQSATAIEPILEATGQSLSEVKRNAEEANAYPAPR